MTETTIDLTKQRKYEHLERLGHRNNRLIEIGEVWIFPKVDGTNASVWSDGETVFCGSRNRTLSLDNDNAGFMAWVMSDEGQAVRDFAVNNPHLILYGEWLVPHTLKTYRMEAWRRFYVFDVYDRPTGHYLPYETYSVVLEEESIDFLRPLCTITNPTQDQLKAQVEMNTYLIAEGAGLGEGIVAKNYAWREPHRDQVWAKVVRNEFKEKNAEEFGFARKQGRTVVEFEIADFFVTPTLVGKTLAKVLVEVANDLNEPGVDPSMPDFQNYMFANYRGRIIPQLLGRVWHDVITEEIWNILKKFKNATIDFKLLRGQVTNATKQYTPDLFS